MDDICCYSWLDNDSRVILSMVFYLIMTPIGLITRLLGEDFLKLKKWIQNHTGIVVIPTTRIIKIMKNNFKFSM